MTRTQRALLLLLASAAIGLESGAQTATATAAAAAKSYTASRHDMLSKQFEDFLSIPNVAADPEGLKRNATFLVEQLKQVGAQTRLLTAPGLENVPPLVWGELKTPGATRTIVFYAHYDGQPVTAAEWTNGKPFTPYTKTIDGEERVYARGAGDDKAAIFAQLTALKAIQSAHLKLNANLRFVWEGEEEAGSEHLESILMANRDLIGGDIWLVCDGPVDQTREQSLAFGARGDAHVQITVYGPSHPLYHFSIYVEAPHDICLARRIHRDMAERGRTRESVVAQFEATAKPMADLYVLPSQQRASMTVSGTDALDWSIEQILRELNRRKMLG